MRIHFWKAIGFVPLAAAMAVMTSSSGWGQTAVMRVQIPYEFHAGGKTLPAGLYRFEIDKDHRVLVLGEKGQQVFLVPPVRDYEKAARDVAGVGFRRYGQDYFLARLGGGVTAANYEWPPAAVEKVLSKRANVQMAWVRALSKETP